MFRIYGVVLILLLGMCGAVSCGGDDPFEESGATDLVDGNSSNTGDNDGTVNNGASNDGNQGSDNSGTSAPPESNGDDDDNDDGNDDAVPESICVPRGQIDNADANQAGQPLEQAVRTCREDTSTLTP